MRSLALVFAVLTVAVIANAGVDKAPLPLAVQPVVRAPVRLSRATPQSPDEPSEALEGSESAYFPYYYYPYYYPSHYPVVYLGK